MYGSIPYPMKWLSKTISFTGVVFDTPACDISYIVTSFHPILGLPVTFQVVVAAKLDRESTWDL
jgi:hypothetical protein